MSSSSLQLICVELVVGRGWLDEHCCRWCDKLKVRDLREFEICFRMDCFVWVGDSVSKLTTGCDMHFPMVPKVPQRLELLFGPRNLSFKGFFDL